MKDVMIKNLEKLMELAGDNAYSLAEKTGISQPTINRMLTGKHKDPRLGTLKKIVKEYNVTIDQLLGDAPMEKDGNGPAESFSTSNRTRKVVYKMAARASQEELEKILKIADVVAKPYLDKDEDDTAEVIEGNGK